MTPARILSAQTSEIRDGDTVSLNWPMNLPTKPAFGRAPCQHRVANHPDGPMVFDDWLDMNIQSGSQWDGFRHYGHQTQGRFYNDLTPEEVLSGINPKTHLLQTPWLRSILANKRHRHTMWYPSCLKPRDRRSRRAARLLQLVSTNRQTI